MKERYGIDLGTTYSCVSYVDVNGEVIIVPNAENENTTPSVVQYRNNSFLVGQTAKNNAVRYPADTIETVKRHMGKPDYYVKAGGKKFKPEELSAEILRKLVDDANRALRKNINEVVITVPAYFGQAERDATAKAAKIAGLEKVPVQIRKYDEQKKLEVALIENIQRADLNPIEEALGYYNIMQMGDLSQEEVSKRVGKKRSTVANSLRLLKLPQDMQKSLIDGQITAGHARAILSVVNIAEQRILFGKIVGSGLSVRQAEEMASDYNNGGRAAPKKSAKKAAKRDPDIVEIEQKFIEVFGTKVVLKGSIEKGSIQIDYFSKADLDRLYNVIVKN
jgi:ParB family chromosome partitioning protein